jgi:hypothetical protein
VSKKEDLERIYSRLFDGSDGELFRKDLEYYLLMDCHVPGDPQSTAYNLGKRDMARLLLITGGQYE